MNFFLSNVKNDALNNQYFRHVIYTEQYKHKKGMQMVLYNLEPGQSLEVEEHKVESQLFYIVQGKGTLMIYKKNRKNPDIFDLNEGVVAVVPKKTIHYLTNDGDIPLKLFSIYNPVHFKDGRIDYIP
jgi:mannose-6-phosphate isomerase-like protein (cupin superfamily)